MTAPVRTCGNCACAFRPELPPELRKKVPEGMLLCRLEPPIAMQQRSASRVAANSSGQAEESVQVSLTYRPTSEDLVCWHGWRPIGTLPGDSAHTAALQYMLPDMAAALAAVQGFGREKQ